MRISRKESPNDPREIQGANIPIGTVFDGGIGDFRGPFLRTFNEIVNLEQPAHTWPTEEGRDPSVYHYLPLDIELFIYGPE